MIVHSIKVHRTNSSLSGYMLARKLGKYILVFRFIEDDNPLEVRFGKGNVSEVRHHEKEYLRHSCCDIASWLFPSLRNSIRQQLGAEGETLDSCHGRSHMG